MEVTPQYIYSPRELSRWVRAMFEAMEPMEAMTPEGISINLSMFLWSLHV